MARLYFEPVCSLKRVQQCLPVLKSFCPLGLLFFVNTPAFAADFIHLKCVNTVTATFTEVQTQETLNQETKKDIVFLKIDVEKGRFMSHHDKEWDDAMTQEGMLIASVEKRQNGLEVEGDLRIRFDPVGTLKSTMTFSGLGISTDVDIDGRCEKVNASLFDQAR